jgi:hypothetical protein
MSVAYLQLIILLLTSDIHIDNKTLLVTDFVYLKDQDSIVFRKYS